MRMYDLGEIVHWGGTLYRILYGEFLNWSSDVALTESLVASVWSEISESNLSISIVFVLLLTL